MKDAVQAIAADLRAAMIEELRAGVGCTDVPAHAMSFEEMVAALGIGRDRLRRILNLRIASGEWKKGRVGLGVKYWKVEQ